MQIEQTFGCLDHGIFRSWNEFWISNFGPFRFESIAPAPRNVGVKGRHFGGTTGTRHRPQKTDVTGLGI
jgi:hypothetical protein